MSELRCAWELDRLRVGQPETYLCSSTIGEKTSAMATNLAALGHRELLRAVAGQLVSVASCSDAVASKLTEAYQLAFTSSCPSSAAGGPVHDPRQPELVDSRCRSHSRDGDVRLVAGEV